MWLRALHLIGLTNLSDEQVEAFSRERDGEQEFSLPNQVLAVMVLLIAVGTYVVSSYMSYRSTQKQIKASNTRLLRDVQGMERNLEGVSKQIESLRRQPLPTTAEEKVREIEQEVVALNRTRNKIWLKASIEKYANSEEFKIGAIVTPEGAKIYKSGQREEFQKDAERFAESYPIDKVSGNKAWDAGTGACVDGNGGCFDVSSSSASSGQALVRLQAIFTNEPIPELRRVSSIPPAHLAELFLGSGLKLCDWVHDPLRRPLVAMNSK